MGRRSIFGKNDVQFGGKKCELTKLIKRAASNTLKADGKPKISSKIISEATLWRAKTLINELCV